MKRATTAIALMAFGLAIAAARADVPAIGVAAPLSGESELLGKQVVAGAQAAAGGARVEVADDRCTAEGGTEAARKFVAAKVRFVVGFLCTESIEAALPILKQAGIPTITPGVRTDSLTDRREKTGWLVYRLAPRADAEGEAIANLLVPLWRDSLFAIVDDGTIYGRDLAETFRAAAESKALKPVFFDTYRPQMENQIGLIGRLRRAGATNVMVGGDRDDVAVMARDAAALGARMIFAGGEVLRSASSNGVPLAAGTLMVGLPEWSEIADPAILVKLKESGILPEGYFLPSYAAMQIALAAASTDESESPALTGSFATVLGEIRFNQKGDMVGNPYRLFRFDGSRFVPLESQ